MGMKPRKEPNPASPSYDELKSMVEDLGQCVVFALKHLEAKGGGGLHMDLTTGKTQRWEDRFMNALDRIGYVVDRERYFKDKDG